jgi:AraC-like DNA-binding protein
MRPDGYRHVVDNPRQRAGMKGSSRPRPLPAWASGRAVRFAISVLGAQGRDLGPLLKRAGLSPALVADPEARMPHHAVRAFCEEAVKATGDETLGLHLAEQVRPAVFDALGYVFRSSRSFGDGLRRLAQYHRFVDDVLTLKITTAGAQARITFETSAPDHLTRTVSEFLLGTLTRAARVETARADLDPVAVEFTFAAPADTTAHGRFFRAPLRFGQPANTLVMHRRDLDLPFRHAEPELREVLERRVRDVIARLPPMDTVAARARAVLRAELEGGKPTAAEVGRRLGLSERSLHRRLREEGMTLRTLLHELRRDLSQRYIQEGISINETAFLLGYSEASAFHRSFRQWTGRTPSAYRRDRASGTP